MSATGTTGCGAVKAVLRPAPPCTGVSGGLCPPPAVVGAGGGSRVGKAALPSDALQAHGMGGVAPGLRGVCLTGTKSHQGTVQVAVLSGQTCVQGGRGRGTAQGEQGEWRPCALDLLPGLPMWQCMLGHQPGLLLVTFQLEGTLVGCLDRTVGSLGGRRPPSVQCGGTCAPN